MKIILEFDSQEEYEQFLEKNKVVVHRVTKDGSLTEEQEAMARDWENRNSIEVTIKRPEDAVVPGLKWDWEHGLYSPRNANMFKTI